MRKAVILLFAILLILSLASAQGSNEGTIIVNIIETGECNLDFRPGWNLFSFCSELQDKTSIGKVFSQIEGKYRYIMKWDKIKQSFKIYSPLSEEKPFLNFDDNYSYFVYMEEEYTLNIPGYEAGDEERDLASGWNTPSYPYRISLLIETIIDSIRTNYRYIMKWDNLVQEFKIYSPLSEEKPFDSINQGEGQFIYMLNPDKLFYTKP